MSEQRGSTTRVFLGVGVGTLLLQLAWIVSMPTFRGPDEFDHVYKADAVAAGQLRGEVEAADGRGQLLAVRPGVVEAASAQCRAYDYTGPDNCRAVGPAGSGRVLVASAAASYDPFYYAVAGVLARPFDGHAFDLALRVVTACAVALLLAAAAATLAASARTPWPLLALAVAVTPTLVLSGATAAPNGVGYAGAALWWASAVTVASDRRPPWGRLGVASVVLVATHTLNVMWLPLMTLAVLVLRPPGWWSVRLRSRRALACVVLVALAGLACVAWIRWAGTNRLNEPADLDPLRWPVLVMQQVVWSLQTVAAGAARNESLHPAVYVLWAVVLLPLLWLGVAAGDRRLRASMAVVAATWVVVPLLLTVVSYPSEGYAWQGRYALPVAIGLVVLAGRALDDGAAPRESWLHVGVASLGVAQVWSVVQWAAREAPDGLGLQLSDVLPLPLALVVAALVAAAGVAVAVGSARRATVVEAVRAA